ncbi:alpha/beta hydrolase [Streptomyces formicae]|uniref:Alpha/beta hydrolase n=2 Tax=Streptomyces formicae TaxID=1616117 RepID=A0ABY3WW31_9ACTN|nr:alpha/beta hydrolase [Streptomyces formicae]
MPRLENLLQHDHTSMASRRRKLLARTLAATAVLAMAQTAGMSTPAASAATTSDASAHGTRSVATVTYNLGDQAYRLPGSGEPAELAATVHYPKDLGATPRPLVVELHGWHATCADHAAGAALDAAEQAEDSEAAAAASQKLSSWPCAPGVQPIDSASGYDYLGEKLAGHGFIVVSIHANGINASSARGDENASVRADLINKHLALWQRLNSTGKGGLAGAFRDAATGKPKRVDFAHHVDLNRVGTMGHSRGGAGVTWHASDRHQSGWPTGVKVKAVLALAPAYNVMTEDMTAYEIRKTPFAVVRGTCDGQVGSEALGFAADAATKSKSDFYQFQIHGANHNYFNTQWSPSSGQVAARDDAGHVDGHPGRCTGSGGPSDDAQLTEAQQRQVGAAYIDAFFRRYLADDHRFDPVLTGKRHPLSSITSVDVKAVLRERR